MPITRDFRRRKKDDPFRQKELKDNNWTSGYLFTELPLDVPTVQSQLYVFKRQVEPDGIKWKPIRVNIESLFDYNIEVRDEGSAFTTYLPTETFDEEDAAVVYTADETFDEEGAY